MVERGQHHFEVGLLEGGKYAAISTTSPYFCFVANSHQEVVDVATRALDFYFDTSGVTLTVRPQESEAFSITKRSFRSLEALHG